MFIATVVDTRATQKWTNGRSRSNEAGKASVIGLLPPAPFHRLASRSCTAVKVDRKLCQFRPGPSSPGGLRRAAFALRSPAGLPAIARGTKAGGAEGI